jgi:FkbM family methyltransferase
MSNLLTNAAKALARNVAPRLAFQISIRNRFWDEVELDILDLIVDPARTAIDVGANTGRYALPLSWLASHVFAIEPNPHVARLLRAGLSAKRVTVLQKAVSDAPGFATLSIPTDRWGNGGENLASLRREFSGPTKAVSVPTMTLDELRNENVGFLKMDIEGHELTALKGATRLLSICKPVVLMECEDFTENLTSPSSEFLLSNGYEGYFIYNQKLHTLTDLVPEMRDVSMFQSGLPRREVRYTNNFLFFPAGAMTASLFDNIRLRLLNH